MKETNNHDFDDDDDEGYIPLPDDDDEDDDLFNVEDLSFLDVDEPPPAGEARPPRLLLEEVDLTQEDEAFDLLEANAIVDHDGGPMSFRATEREMAGYQPLYGESRIVGIRLPISCLTYRVATTLSGLYPGDEVVVETKEGGDTSGRVLFVTTPGDVMAKTLFPGPILKVVRLRSPQDHDDDVRASVQEQEAKLLCKQTIRDMNLPMKLSRVVLEAQEGKIVFFYTAENRVDFRELVRVLARKLHHRVEMRQVGVRDETRLLRGFGPCGRELCCFQHLKKFKPVSVRMAKNQDLSLNPDAISGVCGRLMCCLVYENDTYTELRKCLPKANARLITADGTEAHVRMVHPLKQTVEVLLASGDRVTLTLAEIQAQAGIIPPPVVVEEDDDEEESKAKRRPAPAPVSRGREASRATSATPAVPASAPSAALSAAPAGGGGEQRRRPQRQPQRRRDPEPVAAAPSSEQPSIRPNPQRGERRERPHGGERRPLANSPQPDGSPQAAGGGAPGGERRPPAHQPPVSERVATTPDAAQVEKSGESIMARRRRRRRRGRGGTGSSAGADGE